MCIRDRAKAYAELLCKRGSQLHISAIGIGSPKSRKFQEGADLVKKINRPNLKIVFDIYHMAMEQEDIQELEYALPYVHHIHIAERVGAERRYPSDALYDYYKKLLTPVIRSGYQGAICTEAFDGDVREGAERSIDLLKKIVAEIEQEG